MQYSAFSDKRTVFFGACLNPVSSVSPDIPYCRFASFPPVSAAVLILAEVSAAGMKTGRFLLYFLNKRPKHGCLSLIFAIFAMQAERKQKENFQLNGKTYVEREIRKLSYRCLQVFFNGRFLSLR